MEENNEMEEETPADDRKRPDETTEAEENKQTVTQAQRRHHDPNSQQASHPISVHSDPGMHGRIRTVEKDASVNVGEQLKDSCEQRLDGETKTETQEQRATECQKPAETTSEDQTGFKEQGEYTDPEEENGHKEPKRNSDDEETTRMGQSAEDEGQMSKERKEERLQAGGEEGDAGKVETDSSVINHTTVSEVKSSEDEEGSTQDNSSSEELNETRVEDASVNVGEQRKDSCDQRLDGETKTETQEQRAAPTQRPRHGLYNQGATCYLNSVLQVLFMTPEVHHRLDPHKHTDLQLKNILEGLKKRTCGTENITATFGIKNVYEQRDAAECLEKILHHISPKASEVFRGELKDTTKCSEGHIINEETNPFRTLPLSLKDAGDTTYSVESSFGRIFQDVTYTGKNQVYCYECNQDTDATSTCEMVKAPQILILLLKRFELDKNTRSHFKSHCCVKVPCDLQSKNKYKLYGTVNHMGSIRGGHYTATVRSEDTWYDCNDSDVSQIKQQLFAEDGTFSSRSVYLLTYRASELKVSRKTSQNEKPSKRHLDEETKTEMETEEQRASKKLHVTTSPSQTADAAERQDETSKVDDQMPTDDGETTQMGHNDVAAESQVFPDTNKLNDPTQDDVQPKRSSLETDADDEDTERVRQKDTYELQETSDEALSSQTGGEEGGAETGRSVLDDEVGSEMVNREKLREEKDDEAGEAESERFGSHDKDDESDGETSHMTADENCRTASEEENSVGVETQDNQGVNPDRTHSSITQGDTSNTSEEVKKTEADDASGNLDEGRQNISRWRMICIICFPCTRGNNAEDEGQMRLQAGGEEGDAGKVETDTANIEDGKKEKKRKEKMKKEKQ